MFPQRLQTNPPRTAKPRISQWLPASGQYPGPPASAAVFGAPSHPSGGFRTFGGEAPDIGRLTAEIRWRVHRQGGSFRSCNGGGKGDGDRLADRPIAAGHRTFGIVRAKCATTRHDARREGAEREAAAAHSADQSVLMDQDRRIVGYVLLALGALLIVSGVGLTVYQVAIVSSAPAPEFATRGVRVGASSVSTQTT